MIDAGKAYNLANKQFVSGIRELAQQSTKDEVIEVRASLAKQSGLRRLEVCASLKSPMGLRRFLGFPISRVLDFFVFLQFSCLLSLCFRQLIIPVSFVYFPSSTSPGGTKSGPRMYLGCNPLKRHCELALCETNMGSSNPALL